MLRTDSDTARLVPEEFTHLYHTSCYPLLSRQQHLKYNQLFGLRINEQFIQFEEVFIKSLMPRLAGHTALKHEPGLLAGIGSLLKDEEQHSRMFAGFNRGLRPDLYRGDSRPLTRLSAVEHGLFRMLLAAPGLLPGLLLLLLAMEELTTAISSELISHPRCGELNPAFILLHQRHLDDERRHVGIDLKLVSRIIRHGSVSLHKVNAMLFRKALGAILRPRRSTVQAIRQLLRDEPGLRPLGPVMIAETRQLAPGKAFPANLVTADRLPVLYGLLQRYPDYRIAMPIHMEN